MAFAGLLALLDDIATVLDDVAVMTKVAAKKTAGVLGDDLALNAEQVSGIRPEREIPVVWAVFKGSALNKCILVPAALVISALLPQLIAPLLMIGGGFLCFEGVEKLLHKFLHRDASEERKQLSRALQDPKINMAEFERSKIKGAIRTDFILSAEIVVIALGTVADASFVTQLGVVVVIAVAMTIGVYGLVAGIVKLDDLGLWLTQKDQAGMRHGIGRAILAACPYLLKLLSIVGTAAMFLVGGGILLHGIPGGHELQHFVEHWVHGFPVEGVLKPIMGLLLSAVIGILAGMVIVAIKLGIDQVRGAKGNTAH